MQGGGAALSTRLWQRAVDIVVPPRCLSCRKQLADDGGLCISCWRELRHIEEPVCEVMGTPFAFDQGEGAVSAAGLANPPPWRRARAAVAFDDHSQPLVHGLKYHDRPEAGLVMARMMARAGRKLLRECDFVAPVPLHRMKLWRRRFNQSGFLGLKLAQQFGRPCEVSILVRVKATRPQVGLQHTERQKNVRGAFRIAAGQAAVVRDKKIVLVDDVMTTGATAAACAEALLKAGAAEVSVLVFALVLEPKRFHI